MNIKLIKFTTGEEAVFEVVKIWGEYVVVKNGLTMVFDGQSLRAIPFSVMDALFFNIIVLFSITTFFQFIEFFIFFNILSSGK